MSTQKRGLSWFVSLAITALLHSPLLGQSIVSTVAGRVRVAPTQPVSAISFALDEPCSVAADGQGNVYFTDFGYNMVFRVAGGMLYPFAGTGSVQSDPVGGKATQTAVTYPFAIATDPSGNVYFTEFKGLTRILKVDSSGIITNVAGGGRNTLEFTTFGDNGPASRADFFEPYGLAVDRNGNAYVSLQSTNRLHKIAPNGILTSLAGIVQTPGFSGDNGPSVNSQINLPEGVAADNRGNVYFVDRNNNRIRKIDTAGIITTVAGNGQAGYSGDGGPAINASLALPSGVAVDSSENVFIADRFNNVIRKVDSAGIIRTIA